jgi:hypothetical protein
MVGGTVAYTVTLTPAGGFTGTVTLAAPGLPAGASASYPATISIVNPNPVTYPMAVTAPSSGTGNITVTASYFAAQKSELHFLIGPNGAGWLASRCSRGRIDDRCTGMSRDQRKNCGSSFRA